jgi:hypothetical protein
VPYGMFFSVALSYLGLCPDKLLTCMLVGGLPSSLRVLCGRWSIHVFCGVYGEK